jgi:hypothetical protein
MCNINPNAPRCRGVVWLITLVLVVAGVLAGITEPVQAKHADPRAAQQALRFYCSNAIQWPSCSFTLRTSQSGTVSVQIFHHVNGRVACRLLTGGTGLPPPIIYIDPGDGSRHTFPRTIPANTPFTVQCMRRAASGDASIAGIIYYP